MGKKRPPASTPGRPPKPVDQSTYAGRVGARIRAQRKKLRLTVAEAAGRAGVPVPTWYHWEDGRHLPLDALPQVGRALSCSPRELLPA